MPTFLEKRIACAAFARCVDSDQMIFPNAQSLEGFVSNAFAASIALAGENPRLESVHFLLLRLWDASEVANCDWCKQGLNRNGYECQACDGTGSK